MGVARKTIPVTILELLLTETILRDASPGETLFVLAAKPARFIDFCSIQCGGDPNQLAVLRRSEQEWLVSVPSLRAFIEQTADIVVSDFDEKYYLSRYEDVASAVRRRQPKSGLAHYCMHGFWEGRVYKDGGTSWMESP